MFKEKYNAGKALREKTARSSQAQFHIPSRRPSVVSMISQSNDDRLPELIPIRHFRMCKSPFVFYRATASLMARDLARTPTSGIRVQSCGDCHLMNFGGFATPERTLILDMNDFDETNTAPWEWDLKRLATSFLLAGREKGFSDSDALDVVTTMVSSYQKEMHKYSEMNFLDLWYSKLTFEEVLQDAKTKEGKELISKTMQKANAQSHDAVFYKITANNLGKISISDQTPLVYHPIDVTKNMDMINSFMDGYKSTMQLDRKILLDNYKVIDVALKVVGVGSVGTRCFVVLLMNDNNEPLFLQVKEARQSVLEPYSTKSQFQHQGERVVQGQRQLQAASDMFLGWATGLAGRHFYLRQLRDKKMSPQIELYDKKLLSGFGRLSGNILARAHCKTGQGPFIAGYIGHGDAFIEALCKFSVAYADQTEKDYKDFMKAIKNGILKASDDAPNNI